MPKARQLNFEPGQVYVGYPRRTMQWCQHLAARGQRVLIFTQCESSFDLVQHWWNVNTVTHLPLWLDDTPNITPAYIFAQAQMHAPVGLVVVHGWELLMFDDDTVPTPCDPQLLRALDRVAQCLRVPLVVHSALPPHPHRQMAMPTLSSTPRQFPHKEVMYVSGNL